MISKSEIYFLLDSNACNGSNS